MTHPTNAIRLAIADDHAMLLNGLLHHLSFETDIEVVATAINGKDLIAAVQKHKPHVVLTDLKMPVMHGPEACQQIKNENPQIDIIVYSMYDGEDLVRQMRGLGIKGYLLKSGNVSEISRAVRTVYNGGEYFCTSIRERTNRLFRSGILGDGTSHLEETFTENELKIIRLLCDDYSTKQIADELKLKERTVQAQKEKIEGKMGVRSVVGIVAFALRNWLVY